MATALFQCCDVNTVEKLAYAIYRNPPYSGVKIYKQGLLMYMSFYYDFITIYEYCMNMIPYFSGSATFIGIDEKADGCSDHYSLACLTNTPYLVEYRSGLQRGYLRTLKHDFHRAITKANFTYEEALTIVQRCYIGRDVNTGCNKIALIVRQLSQIPLLKYTYLDQVVESPDVRFESEVGHLTLIRTMAHICYLRLSKFKLN